MILPDKVAEVLRGFSIEEGVLRDISEKMLAEFRLGLQKTGPDASVAMLPTFVPELPTGEETGWYVAIDLSGKNLRMMLLTLKGFHESPDIQTQNFMIHQDVMVGTGEQLFNFIVNCLAKFLRDFDLLDKDIPIGFVFSFPCELRSIRSAKLLWWTKGFNVQDCLQQDVVQLLENALKMNPTIKASVKAVMNDTVGQLASAAFEHGPKCQIGVVIGYGCNSSYLEDVHKIRKFDPAAAQPPYAHPHMVVVTEWEEFGSKGELDGILTSFDREIDQNSVHKGKQIIDKLCGALYLGDLVRRILEQLIVEGVLFGGTPSDTLATRDSFPSKYISEILADEESTHYKNTRRILDELQIPLHGSADYLVIREVCWAVSNRSASIAAAAIAALLKHLERAKVHIGVGGALVQFHPIYMQLLEDHLSKLAPPEVEWKVLPVRDGSIKGAALVAATAARLCL